VPRRLEPGDEIAYAITFLEMDERPRAPLPPRPANLVAAILASRNPPLDYFLYLYTQVGGPHEWTDRLQCPREETRDFVSNPAVSLHTLMLDGWPGGFFMLDVSDPPVCELAYFGLVPQAIGRGLGYWFLATAVDTGWAMPGIERMTVHTNTLDHPRALGLYQKVGFRPIRREERQRILSRERIVPD